MHLLIFLSMNVLKYDYFSRHAQLLLWGGVGGGGGGGGGGGEHTFNFPTLSSKINATATLLFLPHQACGGCISN